VTSGQRQTTSSSAFAENELLTEWSVSSDAALEIPALALSWKELVVEGAVGNADRAPEDQHGRSTIATAVRDIDEFDATLTVAVATNLNRVPTTRNGVETRKRDRVRFGPDRRQPRVVSVVTNDDDRIRGHEEVRTRIDRDLRPPRIRMNPPSK